MQIAEENHRQKVIRALQERHTMTQTQSTPWEKITLANNFLFCKIMESNPDLCKHLIEILLHIEIDHLEIPQAEKAMKETLDSKSVRFDVYTKDDRRIFDLEIQTTNKTNLPKRARYYQSIIDMNNLSAGMNYSQLKDSYVIFLCLGDIFHKGLPVYTFENICLEDRQTKLDDRAFKVFFNAAECDKLKGDEEKAFFRFLKGEAAGNDFTRLLEEKVERAKKNARWRRQYMTWQQTIDEERFEAREEGRREGRREGREEGAHDRAVETARRMLADGLNAELTSKYTNLPLSEIQILQNA